MKHYIYYLSDHPVNQPMVWGFPRRRKLGACLCWHDGAYPLILARWVVQVSDWQLFFGVIFFLSDFSGDDLVLVRGLKFPPQNSNTSLRVSRPENAARCSKATCEVAYTILLFQACCHQTIMVQGFPQRRKLGECVHWQIGAYSLILVRWVVRVLDDSFFFFWNFPSTN